jgi:hypothetical protein
MNREGEIGSDRQCRPETVDIESKSVMRRADDIPHTHQYPTRKLIERRKRDFVQSSTRSAERSGRYRCTEPNCRNPLFRQLNLVERQPERRPPATV